MRSATMQAEVEERVQALVHDPVVSPLEALSLVVHATALCLSWKTAGDVEALRDRASCRAYNAGGRTIETAVVRMGRHAVVLATDVGERDASAEATDQRDACTSCELALDEFVPSSALPLRASNAQAIVTDALVERIASALLPLGSDAAPTPVRSARTQARRSRLAVPVGRQRIRRIVGRRVVGRGRAARVRGAAEEGQRRVRRADHDGQRDERKELREGAGGVPSSSS